MRYGVVAAAFSVSCTAAQQAVRLSRALQELHIDCPHDRIEVLATRDYPTSVVYVLDACGKNLELEERCVVEAQLNVHESGAADLRAVLDDAAAPKRVLRAARGQAASICTELGSEALRSRYPIELSPDQMRTLESEFMALRERCGDATPEQLGSDSDSAGPRWWFAFDGHVYIVSSKLGPPSCDHLVPRDPFCGGL